MNTEERELMKRIADAENKLAAGIKARNDGMAAYRKAQKEYSVVMGEAARKLMERKRK